MITPNSIVGNPKAKIVIDVLIIGALIFVLWYVLKLVKGIGNAGANVTEAAGDVTAGAGAVIKEATTNATTAGANAAVAAADKASKDIKQKPTKTDAELQSMANTIFNAGRVYNVGGLDVDYQAIYRELTKVQNDADFLRLITLFGTQYRYTFGAPTAGKFDLTNFVKHVYGDKLYPVAAKDGKKYRYLDVINANFKQKKPALKFLF
jgi:hypothetical protein